MDLDRSLEYVLKRLLILVVGIMVIITAEFVILRVLPGDPSHLAMPRDPNVDPEYFQVALEKFDKPLYAQYVEFIGDMLTGDFSVSYVYERDVSDIIYNGAGWTLLLFISSIVIALFLGSLLGRLVSRIKTHVSRQVLSFVLLAMLSVPVVASAWVLVFAFSVNLDLFPSAGYMTPGESLELSLASFWDVLIHSVLPIASISLAAIGFFALISRDGHIAGSGPIGCAPSNRPRIMDALFTALPNIQFLVAGTMCFVVIVEVFFSYGGLGYYFVSSIVRMDYFVIQASFFLIAVIVFLSNFVIDLVVTLARPGWKLDSYVDRPSFGPAASAASSVGPAVPDVPEERIRFDEAAVGVVRGYLKSPVGLVALIVLVGFVFLAAIGPLVVTDEITSWHLRTPSYLFLTGATGPVVVLAIVGLLASLLGIVVGAVAGLAWPYLDPPLAAVAQGLMAMPMVFMVLLVTYATVGMFGSDNFDTYGLAMKMALLVAAPVALLVCRGLVVSRRRMAAEHGSSRGVPVTVSSLMRSAPAVLSQALCGLKYGLVMAVLTVFLCDFTGITHWESWGAGFRLVYNQDMLVTGGGWDYVVPLLLGVFFLVSSVFLVLDTLERVIRTRFAGLV